MSCRVVPEILYFCHLLVSFVIVFCAGMADVVNLGLVLGFDAAILYFLGFKSLMYLLVGVILGGGLHPMAGHLIAEHYMFMKVRL